MATTSNPANMDVPISQIDIEYLIDAAEKILKQEFYYISYMLLKEAEKILETLKEQGSTEYTEGSESRIRELLLPMMEDVTIKNPPVRYMGKTSLGKLVLFYTEYKETYQIDWLRISSANFNPKLKGEYETREYILTTSKALRTALKMLSRVTPQNREIIREEFLQDTEYDEKGSSETYRLPAEANMDVPISQIDIEYLTDAAEKIFKQDFYYISHMLLEEAGKILETLKEQGSAEYTEGLESRIRNLLSLMTEDVTIKVPDGYAEKTTIGKLVLFYTKYKEEYKIDRLLRISSANFQVLKGEYETRDYILATSKALRTALKMLSRVARGNTPEKVFIRENEIPEEFLQDTEYDEEGSSESYRLPAESQAAMLPQAVQAMTLHDPDSNMDIDASSDMDDNTGLPDT